MPHYDPPITIRHVIRCEDGLRDYWYLMQLAGWNIDDAYTEKDVLALLESALLDRRAAGFLLIVIPIAFNPLKVYHLQEVKSGGRQACLAKPFPITASWKS
ncbi:hypothetical protein MYX78_13395 [Acidobacteria bacterium AH-259-G07]|nr:hypothetical protein [Acidobacteria bacterium AH-259-G07]